MSSTYWRFGILGWPLGYSLSPLMHRRALEVAGLQGEYKEYPINPEKIWEWLNQISTFGLDGFNVTMPYKRSVFAWVVGEGRGRLGRPEAADQVMEALNTVVMEEGRPVGYNTDGEGFLRSLTDSPRLIDLTGWDVLLLGAGGAAQTIAVTLVLETKIRKLTIWNRTAAQAKTLALKINGLIPSGKVLAHAHEERETLPVEESHLVINATPIGMNGKKALIDLEKLNGKQLIYDLVYEPRETALIHAARERGCQVVTGDEMLAGQGAVAFELWTGVKGMLPVMRQALEDHFAEGK